MALRRLARRALHRSSATPATAVSLSSSSRGYLLHLRFCTSSSTPPHFMIDYLVSTCGLPPGKAAKAAPQFAHLSSPDKPDAVLAFLRSKGLNRMQVRGVVLPSAAAKRR